MRFPIIFVCLVSSLLILLLLRGNNGISYKDVRLDDLVYDKESFLNQEISVIGFLRKSSGEKNGYYLILSNLPSNNYIKFPKVAIYSSEYELSDICLNKLVRLRGKITDKIEGFHIIYHHIDFDNVSCVKNE